MFTVYQVGVGVVGTAYASAYRSYGYNVHAVDINESRVQSLRNMGIHAYLPDQIPVMDVDFVMISVNTPLDEQSQRLNLDWLQGAMTGTVATIVRNSKTPTIVVVRSTVPPGTTEKVLMPMLEEASGKKEGEGFHIAYQPEFLRAKSAEQDALHPWQIVFGARNEFAFLMLEKFYSVCISEDRIARLSIMECELHKLAHNFANALKISFANFIWLLASNLNREEVVDASKVLQLVSLTAESCRNPAYGMTPGAPYGGTCLPKDTPEIAGVAEVLGVDNSLPNATTGINMIVQQLADLGLANQPTIAGHNWVSGEQLR